MVVAFGDVTWSKIAGAWDVYRRAAQLKLRANKGSVPGTKLHVNYMPWFGSWGTLVLAQWFLDFRALENTWRGD